MRTRSEDSGSGNVYTYRKNRSYPRECSEIYYLPDRCLIFLPEAEYASDRNITVKPMMVPLFRGIGLNAKWKSIYKKELIYQILRHL